MSRIQQGSLLRLKRKSGPDVWVLRWYDETGGTRIYRKRTLGNVIRYPHLRDAERAADALRNTINSEFIVPETVAELATHYREHELTEEKKAYATVEANTHYLTNHIVPKWGTTYLTDVRTVDVEMWLHSLQFAPGTRSKIRNIMSAMFNHAIRHEWMYQNPITKVRTSAKRLREPDVLTPAEIASLLAELELRERAMVMLAGSTGLRRSELVALTWADIDLVLMQVNVRRSCVRNHFGDTKTEASRKPVPLHPAVVKCLEAWRKESPYKKEENFVFPSIRRMGKQPLSPDTLLKKVIRPAVLRAGITEKTIGWHSFRHSLATNLRDAGVDLKTAQELLRHANSRITLDVYTRAISARKREANNRIMTMVLQEGKKKKALPAPSKGAKAQMKKGADRSSTLVSTLKGGS